MPNLLPFSKTHISLLALSSLSFHFLSPLFISFFDIRATSFKMAKCLHLCLHLVPQQVVLLLSYIGFPSLKKDRPPMIQILLPNCHSYSIRLRTQLVEVTSYKWLSIIPHGLTARTTFIFY